METDQEKQTESSRKGGIGPGERLQAARIKKGLSIEDVANRMHLSTSILEAIEDNNFDEITAPIFVKGYLRAYARIVTLSEDEMIEQYLDLYSEEDPPISSTSNMVPELSSTDTRIKWTTYFVVILLAVLLAAWWWNKQQNQEPPVSLDVQSSATVAEAASETVVESEIQAGSEDVAVEPEVETEAVSEMVSDDVVQPEEPSADESGTESPGAESAEAVSADNSSEAATTVMLEPEMTDAPAEPLIASVEAEPVAATPESAQTTPLPEVETSVAGTREQPNRAAPAGSDRLRIVVNADTWADVKDASNYQLVYDLLRADSTAELTGQAPFAVFLGNGHGVEIFFNDEEIRFSSRVREDNTARLQIEASTE